MDFAIWLVVAQAMAFLILFIQEHAAPWLSGKLQQLTSNRLAMQVLADALVGMSNVGAGAVPYIASTVFGTSLGEPLVLLFAAMWFATALHLAYLVRQAAEEIETPPTKDGVDG